MSNELNDPSQRDAASSSDSSDAEVTLNQEPAELKPNETVEDSDSRVANTPSRRPLFFDTSKLPQSRDSYVAWVDVMGARQAMSQSLFRSANFIGKLHVAILKSRHKPNLLVSPFMDGAYVRSPSQQSILTFLRDVFEDLAYDFVVAREHRHRFMVRSGLAFGSIIQGSTIPTSANLIFGAKANTDYRNGIYLGYPMTQAYAAEGIAPPFGISIQESARSFCSQDGKPLSGLWWRWHQQDAPDFLGEFREALKDYFNWCETHSHSLGYDRDRMHIHRELAFEYFDI